MYLQYIFLLLWWFCADDSDAVDEILFTPNLTSFCFYVTTYIKVTELDFSYYHLTVAVHFILFSVLIFACTLKKPGWYQLHWLTRIVSSLNCLAAAIIVTYQLFDTSHAKETEAQRLGKEPHSTHRFYVDLVGY